MIVRSILWRAIPVVGLAALLGMPMAMAPVPALAYVGCQSTSTATVTPGVTDPGGSVTLTTTFKDCNGNGLAGITVTFAAVSDPCSPVFTPTQVITDANGNTTTTVFFPANCTCVHTISATGAGITLTATVRISKCLPFTSSAATVAESPAPPIAVLLAAAGTLLIVSGAAVALRHRRTS